MVPAALAAPIGAVGIAGENVFNEILPFFKKCFGCQYLTKFYNKQFNCFCIYKELLNNVDVDMPQPHARKF